MNASEKLKALLHAAETAERGWDNDIHGEPLLTALPQIVAVVEQVRCKRDPWGYSRCSATATREQMCEACAALRALEEALS